MQTALGYIFIIMATICWSTIGPLGLYALNAGISPVERSFWGAVFGFILFFIHACVMRRLRIPLKVFGACFLFGCVGSAGMSFTNNFALLGAGAGMASMLQNGVTPVFTAIFGLILFKEFISSWRLTAIITVIAGLVLICVSGGGLAEGAKWWGVAAGIVSGFCYSMQFCFLKNLLKKYPTPNLFMGTTLGTAAVMLPFVDFMPDKTVEIWLYLFVPIVISGWMGSLCYASGLKRLEISRAGVLITIEPVLAAILAWILWDEMFSVLGWIGSLVIIIGVMLTTIEKQRRPQKGPGQESGESAAGPDTGKAELSSEAECIDAAGNAANLDLQAEETAKT
ncbi:MAG: DMT family transporter [Desulfovibrionaceae bacterium]|nr:DMT family transporter [Desulfovibrionaceae bacterium]